MYIYVQAFLLRLTYIPIALKNYGMCFLPCPFHIFVVTMAVGNIPFSLLWAQIGSSASDLFHAVSKKDHSSPFQMALMIFAMVATVLLLFIVRYYTQKLSREVEDMKRGAAADGFIDDEFGEDFVLPTLDVRQTSTSTVIMDER